MKFQPYPGINPASQRCGKLHAWEQSLQNIFPASSFCGERFLLHSLSWHRGDSAGRALEAAVGLTCRDLRVLTGQPAPVRALEHLPAPHTHRPHIPRQPRRPQRRGAQGLHLQRGEREAQRVGRTPGPRALRVPHLGQLRNQVQPLLPHVQQIRVPVLRGNCPAQGSLAGALSLLWLQSNTRICALQVDFVKDSKEQVAGSGKADGLPPFTAAVQEPQNVVKEIVSLVVP